MKKNMALSCALRVFFTAVFCANLVCANDIGMFSRTNPNASSQSLGTPARIPKPLNIGIAGYSVEGVSEYGRLSANTSFNVNDIRIGAVVEYTALDSIYDRLQTQWELAYSSMAVGFGMAYNLNMERLSEIQDDNWATHRMLVGAYGRYPEYFMYSALLNISLDSFHTSVYDLAAYWLLNSYTLYIEYEWDLKHSFLVGQELFFGSWGVECAYKYPGSRLYLGIAVWFENVNAFAGVASVSKDYQGRIWKIGYGRN